MFYGDRSLVPAWVLALAVGEWTELANTNLSGVQYSPTPYGNDPRMKVDAWNSFVVDPVTSRFYNVASGGHNDYAGNEVEYLDLNKATPNWVRVLDPTPNAQIPNPGNNSSYYNDGRPGARHSYYGVSYSPNDRRIHLLGGAIWDQEGDATSTIASYNLNSNTYNGSGTHPNWSMSMLGPACCNNPLTGIVYVLHNFEIGSWNPNTNTWTTDLSPSGVSPETGQYACSAFDTTRGGLSSLVVMGQ